MIAASIELSNKTFEAKENLDKARSNLENIKADEVKLNQSIENSKSQLDGKYSEKCPNGKAIEGVEQEKCDNHKKLLADKTEIETKFSQSEKDIHEWGSVFENSNEATSLSTQAISKAINSSSRSVDSETIVALSSTVKSLVTDVFFDDLISTCVEGMANLAMTDIEDLERSKSLTGTLEATNRLSAQTSFIKTCEQVILSRKTTVK